MSQAVQAHSIDCETLELKLLRLPQRIDDISMPQIMADLERLLEPGTGVMLDFTRTDAIDRSCLKVFEFAKTLATERSASLGYMGETAEVRAILQVSDFFRNAENAL